MEGAVALWLLFGIAGAIVGSRKDQVIAGFLAGVLLGPLGLLIVILVPGSGFDCPYCRERVKRGASVCPHCRRQLGKGSNPVRRYSSTELAGDRFFDPAPPAAQPRPIVPIVVHCPACHARVTVDYRWSGQVMSCPACRNNFTVPAL